ncbi:MAG: aldo/keto reductase [Polyangiaceae bacterium]
MKSGESLSGREARATVRPRTRALEDRRCAIAETGLSVARIALAWVLTRKFVTSVIIGARTPEQLTDNLAASDVSLSEEHVKRLDEVSALPAEYPGWMVGFQNRDRRPPNAV